MAAKTKKTTEVAADRTERQKALDMALAQIEKQYGKGADRGRRARQNIHRCARRRRQGVEDRTRKRRLREACRIRAFVLPREDNGRNK